MPAAKYNYGLINIANNICLRNLPDIPSNPCEIDVLFPIGPTTVPIRKLKIAPTIIANKKFCALDSHSIPTAHITIIMASAKVPTIRVSFTPPSMI